MRGLCFEAVGTVAVHTLPDPEICAPGDAIVAVVAAGLCGSDLHPFFGREKGLDPGTVMGHEFVGIVIETGADVRAVSRGDQVCAPFSTSCGRCFYCRAGLTSRCTVGQLFGWRQAGVGLHGAQAEFVRVPLADGTLMRVPPGMDDASALLFGDNLATAFFCAELAAAGPQRVHVVIGCGTVGLLAIVAARRLGAERILAIDHDPVRQSRAAMLGADTCTDEAAFLAALAEETEGRGADAVMELVGLPEAQRLAFECIRPGGTLATVGCHSNPHFAFGPAQAYDKNLTYRTGRCPARHYMQRLVEQLAHDPIDTSWCITHRAPLERADTVYDTFAYHRDGCIKAMLTVGT